MNSQSTNRLVALIVTLLFHAAIVALLLLVWMYPPELEQLRDVQKPFDDSEILLGSEYVVAGDFDVVSDNASVNDASSVTEAVDNNADDAVDLADRGQQGDPIPAVTTTHPSPAKETVRPVTETPGAKKSTDTSTKPASKTTDQPSATVSSEVNRRVNFGTSSGTPGGKEGSPTGTDAVGSSVRGNVAGRTLAHFDKPQGRAVGTIVIAVKVDRTGKVTDATYSSGKGAVAASSDARKSCINAALRSRFSVSETAPATQTGTITYIFK